MSMNILQSARTNEPSITRSLYECSHARVKGDRILCRMGHPLLIQTEDGGIDIKRLAAGHPLAYGVCQDCSDFDRIGPPLLPEERGWLTRKNGEQDN